ncbi:MAG: hypothetical protein HZA93_07340 [Verrucomicrobia bacterium]|nr:hypothetical protein [Verrucomicrobiota bacterium]
MFSRLLFVLLATFGTAFAAEPSSPPSPATRYRDFILAAGNAETDPVRLAHLKKLAHQCTVDGVTLPGLDKLIAFVERWDAPASRLDFFNGEVRRAMGLDFGLGADSPLQPIADFYAARCLVWICLEYSEIYPFPDKRAEFLGRARRHFESAAKAFPDNRIARMYLGEPIPPVATFAVPAGAPAWAVAQREGLERLTDIIEWWIDHRLRPNGEYGGGWGDDCEMWRHWVTLLYGFEHPRANWAQGFHSSRLLAQPHLAGGYHNRLMDVEHTAEDVSDALSPMMFLAPGNPEWAQRANRLVDLMERLWTGRNERGFLQFKSTYFTSEQVDPTPARACDTVYHPRAILPALLYWQRTGDARIGRLVADWMRTWVDAAAREERGKPAGILPTAIHWPDGRVGGVGEKWWLPENYTSPLYDFPSAMALMLNTLVLTAHMTGDNTFLAPLRTMATARLDWLKAGRPDAPAGTRLWCAARLDALGGAVAKYRAVTGDTAFDALLREERDVPYVNFRLAGDEPGLARALDGLAAVLRVNFPAYTQEVRYTDRVMRFPVLYQPGWMLEKGAPATIVEAGVMAMGLNRLNLLYQTATGDPGDPLYFPLNAVRWRTPPRAFAALVTVSATDRFAARLYHFGPAERKLDAELHLLRPGDYRVTLTDARTKKELSATALTISSTTRTVALALPPAVECALRIEPVPANR